VDIAFAPGNPASVAGDALIVPVASGDDGLNWSRIGRDLGLEEPDELAALAGEGRFTGAQAQTLVVPTFGRLPARRLVLTGLGSGQRASDEAIARSYGAATRAARHAGAARVVAALPRDAGIDLASALEAAASGAAMAIYRFDRYRGSAAPEAAKTPEITSLTFVDDRLPEASARNALDRAAAIAGAVNLSRDLVNEPGAFLTPEMLAARAREIAAESGLAIDILGPDELAELGAAATLAVGGGSAHGPRLIRLRYDPSSPPSDGRVPGLVGKAITFDTGGYSIKPYEGMLDMKGDMAGGAAVLGAMSALRQLACPIPVEATICAAENMISGSAFRPGDVLRGMNGVTMEILSTDAEGRLVLADGLVDTARRGVTELIDLATLTGAAVVALGEGTTALFASDDDLAKRLLEAADETGERLWRMPLTSELEKKIEGDVADIKNTGGRAGGAITAALFLQHFREGLPWAHLDIAGSSMQSKPNALGPKGATGVGVRTLLQYLTAGAEDGAAGG
jgi:leucyl aminopeptidase